MVKLVNPEAHDWIDTVSARAMGGKGCTRAEALRLAGGDTPLNALMAAAARVREALHGRRVSFCAIVNARSGACSQDCRFCAQSSRHRTGVNVYPLMPAGEMLAHARRLAGSGAGTFGIVTSGPGVGRAEFEEVLRVVAVLQRETGMAACASLGRLTREQFSRLRAAGLCRFHHNLETSRAFYPRICSTQSWDERRRNLELAKAAGLEVCSGGLFGLGESWEDRVDLALVLRELGVGSVPLNFLNPVPGTPLANLPRLSADEALRIIALYRLLLPAATIRVCGGRPTVLARRQQEIFRAGANALMTGDYLTTAGIDPAADRAMVVAQGLEVAKA